MKFKTAPVAVKAVDAESGIFEAIVSVFGNKDSYGDVMIPGSFTNTLTEWAAKGDPIPVYYSHRMDDPDYNIGHVLEAEERDEGLWVRAQLDIDNPPATSKAPQVYRLLKGRRVTQFSFAYDVIADKRNGDVNEVHEVKLYEVGPTPIGANQATELLDVKSAAARLLDGVKAGRVLSAKNEAEIRAAVDDISAAAQRLTELLPSDPAAEEDDEKTGDVAPPSTDEPSRGVKAGDPDTWLRTINVLTLPTSSGSFSA